ncbi:MAG: hypothetical protein ACHQ49_01845 [Elusimicrobiota bacterium]
MTSPLRSTGFTQSLLLAVVLTAAAVPSRAWTDEPLVPGKTKIRAVHVVELRAVIDSSRTAAGMEAYAWTHPSLAPGSAISAADISDLRSALTELDVFLGCPAPVFTDPVLTPRVIKIRTVHIEQLRAAFDTPCSSKCYACQATGALTCAMATKAPNSAGDCPAGFSKTQPSACYPGCFSCEAYILSIDSGHNCTHCGTACGSIPNTCWSIVDPGPLNGICPYCPAPPSCWMGGVGNGSDPTNVAAACATAQSIANGEGPGAGRASCGFNETGNVGPNNTCSCSATCLTSLPPTCP